MRRSWLLIFAVVITIVANTIIVAQDRGEPPKFTPVYIDPIKTSLINMIVQLGVDSTPVKDTGYDSTTIQSLNEAWDSTREGDNFSEGMINVDQSGKGKLYYIIYFSGE